MAHDATRLLKQLGAAIKTSALYPPSHPGNAKAVDTLFDALRAYMGAERTCCVDVGKDALSVNAVVVDDRAHANLAYFLYSRKLAQFKILPSVTRPQLIAFLAIVAMERTRLEEAGGVAHLLIESGAEDIEVTELALEVDEDAEILGVDAFFGLLVRGRLSLDERERLIDILRAGPEQIGKLLQNTYALAREVVDGNSEEGQVQQVLEVVRSLDRLILDEPFDDRPALYTNLAEAIVLLEKPLGPRLARAMLLGTTEDVAVQVTADHLTAEELAAWMLSALAEGDIVEQLGAAAQQCALDREKAKGVLAVLDTRLSLRGGRKDGIADALSRVFSSLPSRARSDTLPTVELKVAQTAVTEEELERYVKEAAAIDEASSIREVIKTCVDVLANEMDKEELLDFADGLAGHLFWLLERREFALLRDILKRVKRIASTARGARAEVISGLLESVTHGPLLDKLLVALWEGRTTPVEQEIGDCVEVLADELVGPLMHVLGTEPRPGMRAILCELLVRIGPGRVDELGSFVADSRWYLVRNVASILGRLGAPQGIPYLARLLHHWDYRVRAQTVDALVNIGTDDAQALIVAFLNDADQRIRLRALRSLDARGMQAAMPALLDMLDRRDPFHRLFELRHAVIEAVARLGARDALPKLEKLARAALVFSRQGRELRRLARTAVSIIEAGDAPAEEYAP
jgi:hypothetical protein